MIKQILKKALLPAKKQAPRPNQHGPRAWVDNASSHGSETSSIGRQNSDGSICFPMDALDADFPQQAGAAPVLMTGDQAGGDAVATDNEDDSNSVKRRKQGALQRRRQGTVSDPMTSLYQISTLLSLSTFFEYKVRLGRGIVYYMHIIYKRSHGKFVCRACICNAF
jgi:hypothetical protein